MNIVQRREQLGLSQKELAEQCNISQSLLCDIEKGRCKPSLETAIKLSSALDVNDINFFSAPTTV